jgi:hypothetical protein
VKDADRFKCSYEVDDGYVGGSRQHSFQVRADELFGDETEADLREMYEQGMLDAFAEKCRPYGKNEDEFVAWAQERIAAMKELGDAL